MPPTCFVVMGFGEKTDYRTSRVLDLDRTYQYIIKPAVQAAGLQCLRADEIVHAGTIDVPMYEQLYQADLVIADLSTANLNAAYELGIRHALKPATTIIMAENDFPSPFDVNHVVIRRYRHDGKTLDVAEAMRVQAELRQAITTILQTPKPDSPVYTFLARLQPPTMQLEAAAKAATAAAAAVHPDSEADSSSPALATLIEQIRQARDAKQWAVATGLITAARALAPRSSFLVQQHALVTYKSGLPDARSALQHARDILLELKPSICNNSETLGLWGAVHKRLFDLDRGWADLDTAINAYEKGYRLLNDHYNGINYAFLLNLRAAQPGMPVEEAIADFVQARRVRRAVADLCDLRLAAGPANDEDRYWLMATLAEAQLGQGDEAACAATLAEALPLTAGKAWMAESTASQLDTLRTMLAQSPLQAIQPR